MASRSLSPAPSPSTPGGQENAQNYSRLRAENSARATFSTFCAMPTQFTPRNVREKEDVPEPYLSFQIRGELSPIFFFIFGVFLIPLFVLSNKGRAIADFFVSFLESF